MGKGDKRSRKGKIWRGSFGNTRRKKDGTKPAFTPKPKTKKVAAKAETAVADMATEEMQEGAAAKPKKAAAKKPKAEGEKKAPAKKKAPAEKKSEE